MTKKYEYSWDIAKWLGAVEINVPNIPAPIVMSLINVESNGDPSARKRGMDSQFYGLLQMGKSAGIDVGFRDLGVRTTKPLHGNGVAALKAFSALMLRYADRIKDPKTGEPDPERVALLWKAGAGFTSSVNALIAADVAFDEAVNMVASNYSWTPVEYLERFRSAYEVWSTSTCG
jgi:hypothetical protein